MQTSSPVPTMSGNNALPPVPSVPVVGVTEDASGTDGKSYEAFFIASGAKVGNKPPSHPVPENIHTAPPISVTISLSWTLNIYIYIYVCVFRSNAFGNSVTAMLTFDSAYRWFYKYLISKRAQGWLAWGNRFNESIEREWCQSNNSSRRLDSRKGGGRRHANVRLGHRWRGPAPVSTGFN